MAKLKLNQIIAIGKGVKGDAEKAFTQAYKDAQTYPRLSGLVRTYKPTDDEGDKLPSEGTRLQLRADEIIHDVSTALTRWFDVELTNAVGNQNARADVVLPGLALSNLPVSFLLSMEKKLVDLHTFVLKLPVLPADEEWEWSEAHNAYTTSAETTRSKKVPRNHVKAEATEKHQAQVEVFTEDVIVGRWTTTKLSGALPQTRVNQLLARVTALQEAVKIARETANSTEVDDQHVGVRIFDYLFAA